MEATAKTMYNNKERRRHRKQLYTGKHLLCTAILVAVGVFFVMPIRLSDEPTVSDPGGDPISATDGMMIEDQPIPLCASVTFSENEEPILPDMAEPVLPEVIGESLDVPTDEGANNGFKSYMDYRTITSHTSMQYSMQQDAWTDDLGLRRYGDYYMVALGTFYAESCGEAFRITLDSGFSFDAITGDIKDDKHTDEKHQHRNGVIVEFIVDSKEISRTCRVMGDMSYAGFSGRIESIERLNQL